MTKGRKNRFWEDGDAIDVPPSAPPPFKQPQPSIGPEGPDDPEPMDIA
jgi:hypothetical protein